VVDEHQHSANKGFNCQTTFEPTKRNRIRIRNETKRNETKKHEETKKKKRVQKESNSPTLEATRDMHKAANSRKKNNVPVPVLTLVILTSD